MVSIKNERYCVSRNIVKAKTINNCMKVKFLDKHFECTKLNKYMQNLRIKINVSCRSSEMVSGATSGECYRRTVCFRVNRF